MNLKLLSTTQFTMNPKVYRGGPWIHLATVERARPWGIEKHYICFKHSRSDQVYIEELDPTNPELFLRIKEDAEFNEVQDFLRSAGVLTLGKGQEIFLGKQT